MVCPRCKSNAQVWDGFCHRLGCHIEISTSTLAEGPPVPYTGGREESTMHDFNKILTNFETNVLLNYMLHIMSQEQRTKVKAMFPVQYNKVFFPEEVK